MIVRRGGGNGQLMSRVIMNQILAKFAVLDLQRPSRTKLCLDTSRYKSTFCTVRKELSVNVTKGIFKNIFVHTVQYFQL